MAKLTEIWETAADSGALPHDLQSVAVQTFRFTLRHYQQLNDLRNQLEQQTTCDASGIDWERRPLQKRSVWPSGLGKLRHEGTRRGAIKPRWWSHCEANLSV
ncbi:MAG: hypothetical protein LBE61_15335 [Burkholderiaceae bacterium]|nr:hypothetical protein [Burkholderiaceae bacterium]